MKNIIKITAPLDIKEIVNLRAGDFVNITGNIYAARDAAHKRFFELIEKGEKLPIDLKGQIIFYEKYYKNKYTLRYKRNY